MNISENVLKSEEKAMMNLRALYRKYGYTQYKMSKFEEYDLYVRNKNFLKSDQIITFNDLSGRLMALRPDVTLSIVKNTRDCRDQLCKYYYNENVYRLSNTSREFKERMQVGLECIGNIDVYSMGEVILLAEKSLETIGGKYVLDISHMGFLSGILDELGISEEQAAPILRCVGEKNAPEIEKLCARFRLTPDACGRLISLTTLYGTFDEAVGVLKAIGTGDRTKEAVRELEAVYDTVKSLGGGENIRLDFSIVNDMNYYNGIIFQGFVDGIPTGILSGGRYDNLMLRFGRESCAIGFAVYLDLLERYEEEKRAYDVDVLLLYDETTDVKTLAGFVKGLTARNASVRAQQGEGGGVKYKTLMTLKNGKLEEIEAK